MDDNSYVHVKVYQDLSQKVSLSSFELDKTADDKIDIL